MAIRQLRWFFGWLQSGKPVVTQASITHWCGFTPKPDPRSFTVKVHARHFNAGMRIRAVAPYAYHRGFTSEQLCAEQIM